jgi:chaperonin GroES
MKLKPLRDRVIVKPNESEEQTKSGIVLPDTAKEEPQEGKVVAVGPGAIDREGKKIPMEVKVGDKVIIPKYGASKVKVEDDEYLILREEDILAIVK